MRDLNYHLEKCMELLDNVGIEYGNVNRITVNRRAKKRWGQCRQTPNGFEININETLCMEENAVEGLENTILHELLHTCKGCMNHGSLWKAHAEELKRQTGIDVKRTSSAKEKGVNVRPEWATKQEEFKYFFRCEKCGGLILRKRAGAFVQHPELYKHGHCGGKMKRITKEEAR